MKKIALSVILALLTLGLFTGAAAAQGNQPPRETRGVMHEYIEQALADKLDLILEAVEAQFDAGATLWQIALDNGIPEVDLPAFMLEVHEAAFAVAVADGVLTQEQADWMLHRMSQRGYGTGVCPMGGTRPQDGTGYGRGRGMGMHNGGYWWQTNP
jgi:hypothetical protein